MGVASATTRSAAATATLRELGWDGDRAALFSRQAAAGFVPGRIVSSGGGLLAVLHAGLHEVLVQRRRHVEQADALGHPAVGDWLALEPLPEAPGQAALRDILPRHGTFVRGRGEDGRPQVLAANVDVALLVTSLDHDLNPRRLERYILLAYEGGVTPVVVLNKVDIAMDLPGAVSAVHAVAPGTRVVVSSALTGEGVEELRTRIGPGLTACLLGSSGVGKSSLTNALLGEERQAVRDIRADDSRGRHTTTRRELFPLPGGGMLIDTPGLRSVGVVGDEAALAASFEDVATLARRCRFTDCGHEREPGCAVLAAVAGGTLSAERLASHHKLAAELRSAAVRSDVRSQRSEARQMGRRFRHHAKDADRLKGRGEEGA